MADFEVTAPNGKKFVVTAPEGASQDDVLAYAQQQFVAVNAGPNEKYKNLQVVEPINPTDEMSFPEKFNAGIGKAFVDVGRGASQLVGKGPTGQEMRDIKDLEAPLMRTGAGTAGNIAGNVALIAPASLIPGAATVPAAGAIGATLAALQPTENTQERLINMGVGGALGAGSQWAGTTGASLLGARAARNETAANVAKVQNAERDSALTAGRQAGYVVPPATINPGLKNQVIESLGGKIATQQQASVTNQSVTDTLARKAIGLRPNAPLNESTLAEMRTALAKPYQEVASLSPTAAKAVEDLKQARYDQNLYWGHYKRTGDPSSLKEAQKFGSTVNRLESLIEREANTVRPVHTDLEGNVQYDNRPELPAALKEARTAIAKTFDVERALTAGGHIDAGKIGKIGDTKHLSGELKTISDFASNFPKTVQTGEKVGSPMIHALRPSIGSAVGGVIGGLPGAAVGMGAGVAMPWAARGAMLSGPGQRALATPSYSPGLLSGMNNAGLLPSPATAGLLSRTAIPAIYMGANQ